MPDPLEGVIEEVVEGLGFELVELERAGSVARPILRARIDNAKSEPGTSVTVDDCARVSRAVEARLDARADLSPRYRLEVSSPGVERPLVRRRDFERFAGKEVVVQGTGLLPSGSKRLEGELRGIEGEPPEERVLIRTAKGEDLAIPRTQIKRIHLLFRWGDEGRPK
jgi:ribosome maturation factor RimP